MFTYIKSKKRNSDSLMVARVDHCILSIVFLKAKKKKIINFRIENRNFF